jgi:hypothetical protein
MNDVAGEIVFTKRNENFGAENFERAIGLLLRARFNQRQIRARLRLKGSWCPSIRR